MVRCAIVTRSELPDPADSSANDQTPVNSTSRRPVDSTLGYQPALDGMRGLGVMIVVVGHLAFFYPSVSFHMSWVIIDQFFVLSGFLITTLLLREYGSEGRISLKFFYARRIGRLYPIIFIATLIALVCCVFPVGQFLRTEWLAVFSIPAYFTNWAIIATNDWTFLGTLSPLWSLAIEEQFYAIWPILLITILRLGGRRKALFVVTSVLLACMLAYRRAIWIDWLSFAKSTTDAQAIASHGDATWNLLYVSTFLRPDGLLVGALLAIALGFKPQRPTRGIRRLIAVAGNLGFVLAIWIFVKSPLESRPAFIFTWGLFAFNVGSAAWILHVIVNPRSPLARFYALRPLVWLGQRSYGIYALHFTVIMFFVQHHWRSDFAAALSVVGVIAVGALSFRFYETPTRRAVNRRFPRPGT